MHNVKFASLYAKNIFPFEWRKGPFASNSNHNASFDYHEIHIFLKMLSGAAKCKSISISISINRHNNHVQKFSLPGAINAFNTALVVPQIDSTSQGYFSSAHAS